MARLQRFFGGPPDSWFLLRPALLGMYSEMLPRLSAEERMDQVSATAAGSGTMKDNDRREFMDSLKRAAHRPGLVKKATKADLASLGIRVEETDV